MTNGVEPEKGRGRVAALQGQRRCPGAPLEGQEPLSSNRGSFVRRFPTSGVVMWSPVRKASEYTRFLASVPSLGHLIVETVSSLASSAQWPRA
jgi:hypothetical protein